MSNPSVVVARSSFTSKLVSSLSVFALVFWLVAPGLGAINSANAVANTSTVTIDTINGQPLPFHCIAGPVTIAGHGTTGSIGGTYKLDINWGDGSPVETINLGKDKNSNFTFTASHTPIAGSTGITLTLYHGQPTGQDSFTPPVFNQCVAPPTKGVLTVTKHVVGAALASSFSLHIKQSGSDVTSSPFLGSETGTDFQLNPGTYTVSEDSHVGYTQTSLSCSNITDNSVIVGSSVSLVAGKNYSCTITNTQAPNQAPVANPGSITLDEDTQISSTLTGSDPDSNTITYIQVSNPSHGVISGFNSITGDFIYTPFADYNGADSFTFRVNDGTDLSTVATISIIVTPTNDAPVALDDSYSTNEDTPLIVGFASGVLLNDTDVELDSLTAVTFSLPSSGVLTTDPDGSFQFTPDADFNGDVTFTYRAYDGTTNSNVATVTIHVSNTNDAPTAIADSYSVNEDAVLNVVAPGILANDSDIDANTISAILVSGVSNGTLNLNSDGSFDYTPNADFNGSDSFTYKANDGTADSSTVTVNITVNPVNDAPTVSDDSNSTPKNTAFSDNVTGTDLDVPANTLTYSVVNDVDNGVLAFNSDGSFTYTPNNNYVGSDSFTFKVNDGSSDSNTATFSVDVTALPTFTLTITTSGEGDGVVTSNDGKINCDSEIASGQETGMDCTETYEQGTVVTLTATPDEGSNFDGTWSGACSGTAPCTLTINSGASANAHFALNAVVPPPSGGGGGGGGGAIIPTGGLVIPGGTTNGSGAGLVLGASTGPGSEVLGDASCTPHFGSYLLNGYGKHDANTVSELQKFLNEYMNAGLAVNGTYDTATVSAVKAFQAKEFPDVITPWKISKTTGHFYLTTLRMANIRYCEIHGSISLTIKMPSLIPFRKGTVAGASISVAR